MKAIPVVALASLGCSKNTVDSEYILGILTANNFKITGNASDADVIIVNTCAFLSESRNEALETLRELNEYRHQGRLKLLIATGCMAVRDKEIIHRKCPFVDIVLSPFQLEKLPSVILNPEEISKLPPAQLDLEPLTAPRNAITPPSYAYLKIADGCDNRCSYCRIPLLRGSFRSKPWQAIVSEAQQLVESGVKELVLVSQDSTRYGTDLTGSGYGVAGLLHLLEKLDRIRGILWIRLMYLYPMRITDELLQLISQSELICNYLDIPLQHINTTVLEKMNRPGDKNSIRCLLEKIRTILPSVTIRSTLITGFPGETKRAFHELEDFISEGWIDHLGVFTYSPERDTPAYHAKGKVSRSEAAERRNILMMIQQEISETRLKTYQNASVPVLIDEPHPDDPNISVGRMESQAPEVDGTVWVQGKIPSGTFLPIHIVKTSQYDLEGIPIVC